MAKRARARTNREKIVRGDVLLRGAGGGRKVSKANQRRMKRMAADDDTHTINKREMAPEAARPGLRSDQVPVNDRLEGVIRDPIEFQGGIASYIRDVGVHDVDYDPQVRKVVLEANGKRVVARAADINTTVAPPVVETRRPKRVPDKTFPVGHPGNIVPGAGR